MNGVYPNGEVANGSTVMTRSIHIVFGNLSGVYANLTGISVSCWNESTLSTLTTIVFQSAVETTDANGALDFSFVSSRSVGDTAYIVVDGPNGIHYNGPWALT